MCQCSPHVVACIDLIAIQKSRNQNSNDCIHAVTHRVCMHTVTLQPLHSDLTPNDIGFLPLAFFLILNIQSLYFSFLCEGGIPVLFSNGLPF